jgi:hypothetical protein
LHPEPKKEKGADPVADSNEVQPLGSDTDHQDWVSGLARWALGWMKAAGISAAMVETGEHDDFVHPVYTGNIISKAQNIDWLMKHPRPANRHARFARMDVRLFGDIAQAYGTVSVSDSTGSEVSRSVFTDGFVYRAGRWQAVSAQETVVAADPIRFRMATLSTTAGGTRIQIGSEPVTMQSYAAVGCGGAASGWLGGLRVRD